MAVNAGQLITLGTMIDRYVMGKHTTLSHRYRLVIVAGAALITFNVVLTSENPKGTTLVLFLCYNGLVSKGIYRLKSIFNVRCGFFARPLEYRSF